MDGGLMSCINCLKLLSSHYRIRGMSVFLRFSNFELSYSIFSSKQTINPLDSVTAFPLRIKGHVLYYVNRRAEFVQASPCVLSH